MKYVYLHDIGTDPETAETYGTFKNDLLALSSIMSFFRRQREVRGLPTLFDADDMLHLDRSDPALVWVTDPGSDNFRFSIKEI